MFPRQFQYLIALEQEGHFGRAATRCNVSQPTLSSAIKHLEEQIGVPIIQITDKTFANADCTPRPRLESNAMIALAVHAVQGESTTVVPHYFIESIGGMAKARLLPLEKPTTSRHVGLVWRKGDPVLPMPKAVVERMEDALERGLVSREHA